MISKDSPSLRLSGLPAYHLKRISEYTQKAPSWILREISVTKQNFIDRCNNFDLDIVINEASSLEQDSDHYIQERRVGIMIRAIIRGELSQEKYLKQISNNWHSEIDERIKEYQSGQKIYDGLKAKDLFTKD